MTIHALSTWNEEGKCQGHCDTPLSKRGRETAALLAARADLQAVQTIFTSDLQRAIHTAAPLAAQLGLNPIERVDLREGNWSFHHRDPEYPPKPAPYGFESRDEVHRRGRGFLDYLAQHPFPGPILVVTHASFFKRLLTDVLAVPEDAYKGIRTALNALELVQGRWQVVSLNDASHLAGTPGRGNSADFG